MHRGGRGGVFDAPARDHPRSNPEPPGPRGGIDRNVAKPVTLMATIEYHPARRGLTERVSDWRLSSAACYAGADHCGLIPDPMPPEWIPDG
jgi:hypothetical protein